ncbi:hypothetical protein Q5P01_012651 [Channa striata]|uniref:Uncharacterized protein n=1 Tax=Channa striata TaxID=64152 RepID=A0AA88SKI9_CHASR|nr:hypothetical protein Q5P01_012651 [Channa striata]
MLFNTTTPHISPPKPRFPGYYILILFVLLILTGCAVAVVIYIRRRSRLAELRHRLIPQYSYDPTEELQDWGDAVRDEDKELTEPLYKELSLSFSSGYGTGEDKQKEETVPRRARRLLYN